MDESSGDPRRRLRHEFVLQRRFASIGFFGLLLAPEVFAQSTVRPLPRTAFPSELAWSLAIEPMSLGALASPPPDALFPNTALFREREGGRSRLGESDGRGPEVDLDLISSAHLESDFSDEPGKMNVARGGWDARLGWKTGENQGLTVNLHSEASFYDFTGATGLVPGSGTGEPLNDVFETSLGTTLCVKATETLSWFSAGEVTLGGEDDASLSDSITLGVVGGLRYQAHEDLAFQTGLAGLTMLEDRPWVIPYLGFDWQMSESWRLFTEGSKVRLSADLDPDWTLYGQAAYEIRQYRLNESNPLTQGVMRDEEIDLAAGLEWRPTPGVTVGLEGGIVAWQELEFIDKHGNEASETESDPAPFAALSLSFRF